MNFSPLQTTTALLIGLWLGGAPLAQAQLLEYEGFDYTGTALDTQSGGTGWDVNAWEDPDSNVPLSNDGVSLSFPGTVTHTAVGSRIAFTAVGEAERRVGTTMPLNVEGSTYYFSALVKREGDFRFDFIDNAGNIRWRLGANGDGTTETGVVGVAADFTADGIFPVGETVYVVSKILAHATAADEVFLNVYRAGDFVPGAEPGAWQAMSSGGSGVTLTRFQIRNLSELPLEIDEIRIGSSYADVVGGVTGGPPVITLQPSPTSAYQGGNARFSSDASGLQPLFYQWRLNGTPIPNATNATLSLVELQPSQAGTYTVLVSNAVNTATSDPALLEVIAVTDITVGQQAIYHFDETTGLVAIDSSANMNHGTLFNFVGDDSQWVPSDFGGAISFNRGLNQYIDAPHHPNIGANLANSFSVSAWIRSRVDLSTGAGTYRVLEKENMFFFLQGNGNPNSTGVGGMNFLIKKNGANLTAGIGQPLLANTWYHLVGTYDGATSRIYLDGELKGTFDVPAPMDVTTDPLRIGSDYLPTGPGNRFDGDIDEVGIWERTLSPTEVLELSGQIGTATVFQNPIPQTRFVGGSAVFSVRARGQQPLRYLWFKGATEIREATTEVLALVNIQPGDAGDYHCQISNDLGDVDSASATLTVLPVNDINDGAEAIYHFDDGTGLEAADASGNSRTGQLANFVGDDSQWIAGQVSGALSFDGITNQVVVTDGESLNLGTDATIAFWINPSSYGTLQDAGTFTRNLARVVRKAGQFDLETVDDPGSVRATIRVNGVPAQQNSLALDEWQHFAAVLQAGTVAFYKNGFPLGDPAPATVGSSNANPVVLGSFGGTNFFLSGGLDELGVWIRPLSDTELLTLAGRDAAGPPVIVSQPQSATRFVGGTMIFRVNATGLRPLTYEWRHNGTPIPNSNTNRLVLQNLASGDAGQYTVNVQNAMGAALSAPAAELTVQTIDNVATGIIAYYKFDETEGTTLSDSSGGGHHAELQNAAATGNLGLVGGAFDFDGVDDFAIVPHSPELNLADQASVAVWVNPRTLSVEGGLGRIIRKDINLDFTLVQAGSTFRVFGGVAKTPFDAPVNTVTVNEWQHLAVVTKDGTLEFFRNGRSLAPAFPGSLGPETMNDLIIGNFQSDLVINRIFNGLMDELGLWNRALSAEEIDGIYQNGLVGRALDAPFVPFAIREIGFPTAGQVRLVYFSPYTARQHIIEQTDDVSNLAWAEQTPVVFNPLGDGLTEALFNQPAGQSSFFRVVALPLPPVFSDDFESGAPGWVHGGASDTWELGTPINGPGFAFSGANAYGTDLDGNILAFSDCFLRSPAIDLSGLSRATLSFQQWRNVDPDPAFHNTIVNVLDASSQAVLLQLSLQAGATAGWQPTSLQLPPQVLGRNVIIEFRLVSDGFNLLEGWYIDDVMVLRE